MQTPSGIVVSVADRIATVAVDRNVVCSRCAAGKGCGAGLLGGRSRAVELELALPEQAVFRQGDRVALSLEPQHLLYAAFLVYGLPLTMLLAALTLGWLTSQALSDGIALLWGVAGLLLGWSMGRYLLGRNRCLKQFIPTISAEPQALDGE